MPTDEFGFRADIIVDPISGFNRMNPGQWYEQFFNSGAEFIQQQVKQMPVPEAFEHIINYVSDINPKWGELLRNEHPSPMSQTEFVCEVREKGIYVQISPCQKGIDQSLIHKLRDKYGIKKSPVTFTIRNSDGTARTVTTKKPVSIGFKYMYLLYKMPHMRSAGVSFVNQYHSPVRPSSLAKLQYPIPQTPIRLGEDEVRNIIMVAGEEAAVHILGAYANSSTAVHGMVNHLLFDKVPSQLERIEMSTRDIIKTNCIVGVTRHIFSCFGVDIAPNLGNNPLPFVTEGLELPTDKR